jgi:hypothetical protein
MRNASGVGRDLGKVWLAVPCQAGGIGAQGTARPLRALPDRGIPRLKVISLDMPPFFSILGSRAGTVREWV